MCVRTNTWDLQVLNLQSLVSFGNKAMIVLLYISLTCHTPQSKGKSGVHVYSESFTQNAIVEKKSIDDLKNCIAGYMCEHRMQVRCYRGRGL